MQHDPTARPTAQQICSCLQSTELLRSKEPPPPEDSSTGTAKRQLISRSSPLSPLESQWCSGECCPRLRTDVAVCSQHAVVLGACLQGAYAMCTGGSSCINQVQEQHARMQSQAVSAVQLVGSCQPHLLHAGAAVLLLHGRLRRHDPCAWMACRGVQQQCSIRRLSKIMLGGTNSTAVRQQPPTAAQLHPTLVSAPA